MITTFLPNEYQGGIQNWGIDQDTTGYLYVANNDGLLEFDGAVWETFEIPGVSKSRCLAVEKLTDRIFLGGQGQLGFFERSKGGLQYHDLLDKVSPGILIEEVWKIVVYDDRVFADNTGQLISITADTVTDLGIKKIDFLKKTSNGVIACTPKYLYRYDTTTTTFEPIARMNGVEFIDAAYVGDDLILFTYDGTVYRLRDNTLQELRLPISAALTRSKVNAVLATSNGTIAVATQNNGLFLLGRDLKFLSHISKEQGLNHRTVLSLHEDDFSNLWVGLNDGISLIEFSSPFSLINESIGLKGTGYAAQTIEGRTYLGTSSGLFSGDDFVDVQTGKQADFQLIEGSAGLVNNLSVVNEQLIIDHHEGSFMLQENEVVRFLDGVGSWEYKARNSQQMIGGTYHGFYLFDNNVLQATGERLAGLSESSRIFEFENDSILWMTHGYKGAFRIKLRGDTIYSVSKYDGQHGFPSNLLINVYKIDGELIFTGETGIHQYNQEKDFFEPHPFLNDQFRDSHVSKIRSDGDKRIYFIEDGESGFLERASIGIYRKEKKQFRKINKFLVDDLENISIISNKEVLFGAKEGFVRYQPALDTGEIKQFSTHLKRVDLAFVHDSTVTIDGTFLSNASFRRPSKLHFQFAAPFFDGVKELEYSYRLFPYEENWSNWDRNHWKEYTNPPSGEYTFQVKARNVYGDESSIESYQFYISPYWYESNLAYAIYTILVLSVFFIVIFFREHKHKSEKQIIHQSKDELIKSKEREIIEFSEKTNQQIERMKNEGLKKELDHKNSQLAAVTMHLLSKNEFVFSIRKKINEIIKNKDHAALDRIVMSIDKNINEKESWDTFLYHFDQVHGNFLKSLQQRVHLTPQETKLCAYLKMNMSTKDIANLMNITVRGVELSRYRLRKKLNIDRHINLTAHLDSLVT
ncbi:MAG: triple tyrosine motif-containing protein [Bacteroidota bacterium]